LNISRKYDNTQRVSDDILKRIMDYKPEGRRRIGRPKRRQNDGILDDVKKLELKNCWTAARDRRAWRKVLREAEVHIGLYSY
jgi:hypothetical protein